LAAITVAALLAGCTAGTNDAVKGLGDAANGPVLYLNVTANGQTYRFSTADLGHGAPGGNASAGASGTGAGAGGNATAGNSTAQSGGNATAGSGSASASASYTYAGNGTGSGSGAGAPGGGMPGMPSGKAPLDVTIELGAARLPKDLPVNWTLDWGEAAATQGSGSSANASANPGAARQPAMEQGIALPAHLQHKFTTAGHHEMVLSLLGKLDSAKGAGNGVGQAAQAVKTLTAAVQVTPSGPSPGSVLGNQTDRFKGSSVASAPPLCGVLDSFLWTLNSTFKGAPSVVQRIVITANATGTGDITLTLRDGNGTALASGGSIDQKGAFPAGKYTIDVEACPTANLSYTVDALGQHVAR
jgi:hypothetical protein